MARLFLLLAAASLLALALLPAEARAQTAPPDVVELRDGSFVRGTIVERIEGDRVTIQIVTGEVRSYPMSDVVFAGPSEQRPATIQAIPQVPQPPMTTAPPPMMMQQVLPDDRVTISVRGARSDARLTLHQLTGTATATVWTGRGVGIAHVDAFAPLCTAPCDTRVPRGAYYFGVSEGDGQAARAGGGPHTLDRDLSIEVDYENRGGLRAAGWVTFAISVAAATALLLVPLFDESALNDYVPWLIGGSVLYAVGLGVSLPLVFFNDAPSARVVQ